MRCNQRDAELAGARICLLIVGFVTRRSAHGAFARLLSETGLLGGKLDGLMSQGVFVYY